MSNIHPLNITVMRLFKPKLLVDPPPISEMYTTIGEHDTSGPLTSMLALPETPGDTYLGQKFSAYVRATNMTTRPIKNVKVTVEMHTPSTRISLLDKRIIQMDTNSSNGTDGPKNQSLALNLDEGVDIRVEHLLTELDVHRLQVTVTYTHPDKGEPVEIVKLYPVKVMRPINVTLRSREKKLDGENNLNVFVECALKNLTSSSIVLHSVNFICKSGYKAIDLASGTCVEQHCSYPGQEDEKESFLNSNIRSMNESERVVLRPNNVQHYIFHVSSIKNEPSSNNVNNNAPKKPPKPAIAGKKIELGRLLMMWRTSMGESASLQTAPVFVASPGTMDVTLNIKKVANNIVVNKPFTIDFSIVNNASRDLNLQVLWNNSNNNGDGNMNTKPFGVLGKSTKNIGCITPGSKIDCSVSFIAYKTGLYTLGDILIKDIFTNNIYNVKQNRKIFVP